MSKIISQKILHEDKYLSLIEDTVDYNGKFIKSHNDVYWKDSVNIIPLNDNNEIYLIKQDRYLWGEQLLEAVAGMMEEGEDVISTARRELKEEAGIVAENLEEVKTVYLAGSFIHAVKHIVTAKGLTFEKANPEKTEEIKLVKLTIDDAVGKVISGEIKTALSIIGILLVDEMIKKGEIKT